MKPRVIRMYKNLRSGGGVQSRLMELLPRLAQHVEVRVLCYRSHGDRAEELRASGVEVDLLPLGVKWSPANVSRYISYFREHRPDVVHTHEYTANTLGIEAAARAGVPVRVRHLHTMVPWGWGGRLRTALRVAADRRAARRAQVTLGVSQAVRRLYLERSGAPPESCRVLYNGIDLSRFEGSGQERETVLAELGLPPGAPVVGVVGRLAPGKGHREFLAAAAAISRRLPQARFLVVGEGGLRTELESLGAELGLAEALRFTGYRSDVPRMLGAMDLFLFPSGPDSEGRVQDGLPGAVIEAQAAGLPVVAFALPMMDELVEEGVTGALVRVGDVDALAAAAIRCLLDPAERQRAAARAREAAQRFSLEACVRNTLSLYDSLLAHEATRSPSSQGPSLPARDRTRKHG